MAFASSDFVPQHPVNFVCRTFTLESRSFASSQTNLKVSALVCLISLNKSSNAVAKCQKMHPKCNFSHLLPVTFGPKPWFNRVKKMRTVEFFQHLSPSSGTRRNTKNVIRISNCLTIFCLQKYRAFKHIIHMQFRMTRMTQENFSPEELRHCKCAIRFVLKTHDIAASTD